MMKTKVVVTGLGVVTPLGSTPLLLWQALAKGKSSIRPIEESWASNLKLLGLCSVPDFLPPLGWEEADRQIQFALAASLAAIQDAGVKQFKERGAIYLSSSKGGMISFSKEIAAFLKNGTKKVSENFFPNFWSHSPSSAVAMALKCQGPTMNFVSACASGAHSIMMGSRFLQNNPESIVLAGSTEASLTPAVLSGFAQMGVLVRQQAGKKQNRFCPYDISRKGFVAGEGAAVVVLESHESASKRGAPIYATLAGAAALSDATHCIRFDPSGESIRKTIERSLEDASLSSSEMDYINLHGTGTLENDLIETRALKQVWDKKKMPALSATKPATGHLLGASGALEAVIAILALKHQFVPPTLNLTEPDPECDLDYTPSKGHQRRLKTSLSLSYGFGGHTAALVFKKNEN